MSQKRSMPIFFYIIVILAGIGLITNIFTNPSGLFRNTFMFIGVGVAIFAVVYFLFMRPRRVNNDEMKKYKQALKQSKQKYHSTQAQSKQQVRPNKIKHKRVSHLRVIEGNKSKRKNRAT